MSDVSQRVQFPYLTRSCSQSEKPISPGPNDYQVCVKYELSVVVGDRENPNRGPFALEIRSQLSANFFVPPVMIDIGLLFSKVSPIVESDNITLLSIALTRVSSRKVI